MIDSELRREIKTEIERQVQIILAGISGNNTNSIETIENLYPGMPNVVDRPVMHPYGMVSRAKKGTVQVVARQGEHLGNWVVMGHRDKDRPDVEEGETILYNTDSKAFIYLRKDGFEIECEGVKLLEQLIKLMNTIINARTNTIFGPQPLIPNPAGVVLGETFLQIKQQLTTLKGGA